MFKKLLRRSLNCFVREYFFFSPFFFFFLIWFFAFNQTKTRNKSTVVTAAAPTVPNKLSESKGARFYVTRRFSSNSPRRRVLTDTAESYE